MERWENLNFTTHELKQLNLSQAGAAVCSLVSSVLVIKAIVTLRKYTMITQRLILYLNIAIVFNSTSFIVRGAGFILIDNSIYCKATGYYGQITGGFILASIWCIIIEVTLNACRQKGAGRYIEIFYLILIFVVPTVTGTIPFLRHGYGQAGAWCWIVSANKFGLTLQYVLWYVPLFSLIIFGSSVYFVGIIVIGAKIKKYTGIYTSDGSREERKQLLEEVRQFRWYPVVYFFINLVPLANRIVEMIYHKPVHPLWLATGVAEGLQGMVVAILFFIQPSVRKRIKANLRCSIKCCRKKLSEERQPGEESPLSQSIEERSSYDTVPAPYKVNSMNMGKRVIT